MKKNFKLTAIVAAALIGAAVLVTVQSCKKEKNEVANNIGNANVVSISPNDDMEEYLLNLKKRMKSAAKDGETMSIADAEWNLTALENFGLCDGSKRSPEMIIDTFYTKIRVNNGNISLYDLNLAYENNKKQIVEKFKSLAGNDKNIYFIKSTFVDSSKNDSIKIITETSMRSGGSMPRLTHFGPTDYWYDFNGRGKCGPYEGQCIGRDATTEMNYKVNINLTQHSCDNGRVFYTNIYDDYINYNEIGEQCEDSPYPPDCLYTNFTYYNRCLSPDELNWYLDKLFDILGEMENNYNKSVIRFNAEADC